MRHMRKLCLFVGIAILVMTMGPDGRSISAQQLDASVSFDLSNRQQTKEFYTNLDGEWDFFEKALLAPDEVEGQLRSGMGKVVSLLSSFHT